MDNSNKPISYINSLLSMNSPLAVKRLLKSCGVIARRDEIVSPKIDIGISPHLSFMHTALSHIEIERTARKIQVPKDVHERKNKYTVEID